MAERGIDLWRDRIDTSRAAALYAELRSWRKVAAAMPRADGTCFQPDAISHAVGRADRAGGLEQR